MYLAYSLGLANGYTVKIPIDFMDNESTNKSLQTTILLRQAQHDRHFWPNFAGKTLSLSLSKTESDILEWTQ